MVGKYAEKRRSILIAFTKCIAYNKIEGDRASGAEARARKKTEVDVRRTAGSACRLEKNKKTVPQSCQKSSFLLYIGNVTTLLQADYRYITKAEKALTRGAYMNKMEAYENKHE